MKDPLNGLKLLFSHPSNSSSMIDVFQENLSEIQQILYDLADNFKQFHNYAKIFLEQYGLYYLVQLLEITCQQEDCYFHSPESICCQILILDILANICICTENVYHLLGALNELRMVEKEENGRFRFLFRLLNSNSTNCLPAIINLISKMLSNLSIVERIGIQCEFKDVGLSMRTLEMKVHEFEQANKNKAVLIDFRVLARNWVHIPQDVNRDFVRSEAYQLNLQLQQLNEALTKAENKRKSLLLFERELNRKCDLFVKKFLDSQASGKIRENCNNFLLDSTMCDTETVKEEDAKISLYHYYNNMKSSEEEIVCASVIDLTHSPAAQLAVSKEHRTKYNKNNNNQTMPENDFPLRESRSTYRTTDLSSNYMDNFKASKYYAYIKAEGQQSRESKVRSFQKSIRNNLANMFRANRRMIKIDIPTRTEQFYSPHYHPESASSKQLYEEPEWTQPNAANSESGRDSVNSLSLSNAFRCNFILRKNDFYMTQPEQKNSPS